MGHGQFDPHLKRAGKFKLSCDMMQEFPSDYRIHFSSWLSVGFEIVCFGDDHVLKLRAAFRFVLTGQLLLRFARPSMGVLTCNT